MKVKRGYENLEIWRLGMKLVELTQSFREKFPKEEKYHLWGQLSDSVESFLQNLAEGYGKPSPNDFAHYVDNAIASILESEMSYKIAAKKGYISKVDLNKKVLPLIREIFNKSRRFKTWILTWGGKFYHKTTKPQYHNTTGFTLIELLVVIGIIGILAAGAIPVFNAFNRSQALVQAAKQVKADLRLAQNKAVSGVAGCGGSGEQACAWGLHFSLGSSTYYLFRCTPDAAYYEEYRYGNSRCASSKQVDLNPLVQVQGVFPAYSDIVFDALSGKIVADGNSLSGDITITVSSGSDSRVVILKEGGSVEE